MRWHPLAGFRHLICDRRTIEYQLNLWIPIRLLSFVLGGMYKFKTMPFGLCNAGVTFQRLMNIVMMGLNLDICLVYLGDIIIYSSSVGQHLEILVTVMDRLRTAG